MNAVHIAGVSVDGSAVVGDPVPMISHRSLNDRCFVHRQLLHENWRFHHSHHHVIIPTWLYSMHPTVTMQPTGQHRPTGAFLQIRVVAFSAHFVKLGIVIKQPSTSTVIGGMPPGRECCTCKMLQLLCGV